MLINNVAVIVLSNLMDKYGNLNNESLSRAVLAARIFKKRKAKILITSGWDYRKDSSIFIADAFKKFFVDRENLLDRDIYCERYSRDTVGDAVFSRLHAYDKFRFQKLIVISSEYHLFRVRKIFEFVYPSSIELEFIGSKTKNKYFNKRSEEESLIAFQKTFNKIEKANLSLILNTLVLKHPFYNGDKYKKIKL